MHKYSREWCELQDEADVLADRRALFDIPSNIIYMDGNSLGALPIAARERLEHVVKAEWGKGLIKSWNDAGWIALNERVGAKIAPLVGAHPKEVVLADSTSVNLFKTVATAAVLNAGRKKIISEAGNFPTDLYMMEGLTAFMKGDLELKVTARDDILEALDEDTAVLLLTHVHYVSGAMFDMAAVTKTAHEKGVLVVWDLSHSAGAVTLALSEAGADFAVGCGYKYLNGGPGAPAFIYAAERHHGAMAQPLSGWFGHKCPFDFVDTFEPKDGIARMTTGTTPVLAASALESALSVFDGLDMETVRTKSVALTDLFIALCEKDLGAYGFTVVPCGDDARGSHVSLMHDEGYAIMAALIDHGVIGDFRAPNNLRFGFTPLYMSFVDVWDAVETLHRIMKKKIWDHAKYKERNAVT